MKTHCSYFSFVLVLAALLLGATRDAESQTLINLNFGAGSARVKAGFAATGQQTNDTWNLYSHYHPRFTPGMPLVSDGRLDALKYADGSPSTISMTVSNAPGVWGNATGDPMLDSYVFAPNGSNILVTLQGLEPGRYHIHAYGWAAADVSGEQNSTFTLRAGTNVFGPLTASGATGWHADQPWRERAQYVVFRDVAVEADEALTIEVGPGTGGVAVLNGLQILSRGTSPPRLIASVPPVAAATTNLLFSTIRYEGKLTSGEARFAVTLDVESRSTNEISALLFEGDLALLDPQLPEGWRIVNQGRRFRLYATKPGAQELQLDLVARIERAEPWNVIRFTGPPAAIATVLAQSDDTNVEVQLQSGTVLETSETNRHLARGVLGTDRELALRWQSKTTETTREALVTVDTKVTTRLTPTVIRHTATFDYEILQAPLAQLNLHLPGDQTLTKLSGDLVRDWRLTPDTNGQVLTVDFVRPVEDRVTLALITEQPLPTLPGSTRLQPPQPVAVQRESGALSLQAEDIVPRVESTSGMRQVNSLADDFAAFRFNSRPASLRVQLARVEPLVEVNTRVNAHLEETRLVISHELNLNVQRAGIYALDLTVPTNLVITEVTGDGVDDWSPSDGKLRINFSQRVLGQRKLKVQLERNLRQTPPQVSLLPLSVSGANKETAFIGAGSAPGLQLKTATLDRAREIPVSALPNHRDELLAFRADTGDWNIILSAERLQSRVVAEVFDLITIGDGLVGGSATIRYGIVNQGVQQFRLRLPGHWRNVEFTAPNIRRKDQEGDVWTIALQDKVWGGYTLVITYDYAFDPKRATLDAAGAHPLEVERETGTVAITKAANLQIDPSPIADPLRPIDPTELADADRALISRPVLLAYRYDGPQYALSLDLTRHTEVPVLDAITDRSALTSVINGAGEMLTQASFMVKNNERQYQEFKLPENASLWGAAVNGEPVKADRDGDWILVALPHDEDRDQVFAVDLKYAQNVKSLGRWYPARLDLLAPQTRIPGTYVQWDVYVPGSRHVSRFDGNMKIVNDTNYEFADAWNQFTGFYASLWHNHGPGIIFVTGLITLIACLIAYGRKKGFAGVVSVLVLFGFLAILAGMMLPALSKAKSKAQRIKSVSNLKQIGLAARIFSGDNNDRLPNSFEEMMTELGSPNILIDPENGQRYTYVGAGKSEADPNAILAYSANKNGHREVVLADGSVHQVTEAKFNEMQARENRSAAVVAQSQVPQPASQANVPLQQAATGMRGGQRGRAAQVQAATAGMAGGLTTAAPTATGIRSLRIEIPKSGRLISFQRVLSPKSEPPRVSFALMSSTIFTFARTAFQLAAFLAGLALIWIQWRREEPRALWMAAGIALALLGLSSLLLTWRVLGLSLIASVPVALAIVIAWLFWHFRPRGGQPQEPSATPPLPPESPAATVALVLLAALPFFGQKCEGAGVTGSGSNLVSIAAANYTGSAQDRAAQFEAQFDLVAASTNQSVALFGQDVAVQEFKVTQGKARLWREADQVGVLLPERGTATVTLKLVTRVGGDAGRRQLDFMLPPAIGSRLVLKLAEADAEVAFPSAVTFSSAPRGDTTVVQAVLGATNRLAMSWTPRLKRATEVAATVFAQQTALVTLGGGVINTRSVVNWQVTQGELQQVRIALPEGYRLLRVHGEHLRGWNYADTDRHTLLLDFVKPMAPGARLEFETERSLDTLPATVHVALPRVLDVKRETGSIAIKAGEELGLTVVQDAGLERIDPREFTRANGTEEGELVSAWRYLRPDFNLETRAELLQPRLEAVVRNAFTVGTEQISLLANLDYTISRAGVFVLRVALPTEGRVADVKCGPMQTWSEQRDENSRYLEVTLKQRTTGPLSLTVLFITSLDQLPSNLALAGVHPLGVEKLTGYLAVKSEPGVGLKLASLEGAIEIPAVSGANAGSGEGAGLAYKYMATEILSESPWRLTLATEQLQPWVRAEVASLITVSERLVSGRATVRYDIQNAPLKEFRLRVPDSWRNVEIVGEGIRRRDQTTNGWRVELQKKVRGDFRLTVQWEESRASTNQVVLAGLETVGVERETGVIGVFADGQLQLAPREGSEELLRIDARELPDWARKPGDLPALSYRYLRSGWQLPLEARRFEDAAVLQALADSVQLRSVISEDGEMMTVMEISVRNNGRQNIALALAKDTEVYSAFVDDQPIRPTRRDGRLLLPLERAGMDDAPITVQITFVGHVRFPRTTGTVELESPTLDVPLKNAQWIVYLPADYRYDGFKGTMNYESAELVPVKQDFTLAEYQRQEQAQQESYEFKANQVINKAKSNLAQGNYDNSATLNFFNNTRGGRSSRVEQEYESLQKDLNRAQSTTLLGRQRHIEVESLARLNVGQLQLAEGQTAGNYSQRVAEQQVSQLQKAQAVTVTRVSPLRVNLPTSGLRHSFVQVLQTEVDKPLIIRLKAHNQRESGWITTFAYCVGTFLLLWLLSGVSVLVRPYRVRETT